MTLPQKNGRRIKTSSSKLTILVSSCSEKNFIRNNAHNFFILSLVFLKLLIISVAFFLGHPVYLSTSPCHPHPLPSPNHLRILFYNIHILSHPGLPLSYQAVPLPAPFNHNNNNKWFLYSAFLVWDTTQSAWQYIITPSHWIQYQSCTGSAPSQLPGEHSG